MLREIPTHHLPGQHNTENIISINLVGIDCIAIVFGVVFTADRNMKVHSSALKETWYWCYIKVANCSKWTAFQLSNKSKEIIFTFLLIFLFYLEKVPLYFWQVHVNSLMYVKSLTRLTQTCSWMVLAVSSKSPPTTYIIDVSKPTFRERFLTSFSRFPTQLGLIR